jgi:hypothetical protein
MPMAGAWRELHAPVSNPQDLYSIVVIPAQACSGERASALNRAELS